MTKDKIGLLRKGEAVLCEYCKQGYFYPVNGTPPEKASAFICNHCKLRITDLDINALRKGESVLCAECGIGILKPMYGSPPEKSSLFMCNHCGEKMSIMFKMDKFSK